MVQTMVDSEDGQLDAMLEFIVHHGLDRAMQQGDWTGFARRVQRGGLCHQPIRREAQGEFARLSAHGVPDLRVRTAQVYLMYADSIQGRLTGKLGTGHAEPSSSSRDMLGLPATGEIDDATLAQLAAS